MEKTLTRSAAFFSPHFPVSKKRNQMHSVESTSGPTHMGPDFSSRDFPDVSPSTLRALPTAVFFVGSSPRGKWGSWRDKGFVGRNWKDGGGTLFFLMVFGFREGFLLRNVILWKLVIYTFLLCSLFLKGFWLPQNVRSNEDVRSNERGSNLKTSKSCSGNHCWGTSFHGNINRVHGLTMSKRPTQRNLVVSCHSTVGL